MGHGLDPAIHRVRGLAGRVGAVGQAVIRPGGEEAAARFRRDRVRQRHTRRGYDTRDKGRARGAAAR